MIHYLMIPVETGFMCLAHSSTPDWSMEHLGAMIVECHEEGVELGSELNYHDRIPF